VFISQFKSEGKEISTVTFQADNMQPVYFPKSNEKSVVIFWATWCGPCSVELNRINNAIIKKEIDPRYVYAVNMGEDPDLVKRELSKRKYKFQSYYESKGDLISQLKVEVTPTVAFIDERKTLRWLSSGISPSLIYRIMNFLK
jgi:thiol-disulfide isomerase/thioredoxin